MQAGPVPDSDPAAALFAEFAHQPHCVWLDSAHGGAQSILAASPSQIFKAKGTRCEVVTDGGSIRRDTDPFALLGELLATRGNCIAIGYFGYDLKNLLETLPVTVEDDLGLPDCWFGFYDEPVTFSVSARVPRTLPIVAAGGTPPDRLPPSDFTPDAYHAAVRRAKDYIAAGDIYQVNLAQRFQCRSEVAAPALYLSLRATNPAPYCAYLDIGEAQILSSSPECFLDMHDRTVVTRPIKGTRKRARSAADDARVAEELRHSAKDNAELLMITDLERNDLGKVCAYGSVFVRDLVSVETFATVLHLVSTVEGRLRRDATHLDCVRACFPGGSITGAPKIRAMEIIDELESHARGVYTGAIGYFGRNGESQFNIAIRTVVAQQGKLTFHAGGGIVADSEPQLEYEETLAKVEGIINAIDQLRIRQRPVPA